MAERESITQAPGLFGSWSAARAAKLGEEAFQVAAHMALQERDPAEWPTSEQFAESLAQVFEGLLHARTWPRSDQWALERLAEVPAGFRPGYEAGRLRREHAKAQRPPRAPRLPKPVVKAAPSIPRSVESAGRHPLAVVTSTWVLGGRSEAQGGGEAPLQSGGPN